jgi:glucosamine-6-phosphate deaminase
MEVIIQKDADAAALLVAKIVASELRAKPSLVLGLATGRTMEKVYANLVRMHKEQKLDFSLCRTFNLDEYIGLPPDHPGSYRHFMNTQLFDHINMDPRNTHLPNGLAKDLKLECLRYESAIEACGGIDLQVVGIGKSGHIGFNEPLSALRSRTREKALSPITMKQNGTLFESPDEMPKRGITMGVGTIVDSKRCVMLATGRDKATVIAKAVEGPITSMISATALQLHPHCCVIVDKPAASKLKGTAYYRWIFENEPEWQQL